MRKVEINQNISDALNFFSAASRYVETAGLSDEIQWHRQADFNFFTETDLLREAAWVILCSGFRESVVKRCFGHISLAFCDWESSSEIVNSGRACVLASIPVFRNWAKLQAILGVAIRINAIGFPTIKRSIAADPQVELRAFPFIGPITSFHLAKNLGLDVAKPDRHLIRASDFFGFEDPFHLCRAIAQVVGESARVVDFILWRYIADTRPSDLRTN